MPEKESNVIHSHDILKLSIRQILGTQLSPSSEKPQSTRNRDEQLEYKTGSSNKKAIYAYGWGVQVGTAL